MTYVLVLLTEDDTVDDNEPESYSAVAAVGPFSSHLMALAWWTARPHIHADYGYEVVPLGDPAQPLPPNHA